MAQSAPSLEGTLDPELFDAFEGAVDRHPRHDLGMCEMAAAAAHLPNAFIRLLPDRL
jgi:hypothetical protein